MKKEEKTNYKKFEKCKYFRWGGCLSSEKNINFECCTKNKDCEFKKNLRGFNNV